MVEWCCQEETEVLGGKPVTVPLCFWRDSPNWARASSFTRFLDHTQRRTTVGWPPLDEWSARRRYLYLTTHNTHNRQSPCPPRGIRTHNPSRRVAANVCLRTATETNTMPRCFSQISHGLTIDWTRPFAMTGRRLTTGDTARPWTPIHNWCTENQLSPHNKLTASPWQRPVS